MSVHTKSCEVCGARVAELRRGRCWGCYSQWVASRPVGLGASCVLCGERRRDHLKSAELLGAWMPCCHNCHARVVRIEPMPDSVAELRERLERDRRAEQRRIGKPDTRVFQRDRRGVDRRQGRPDAAEPVFAIDDEMIVESSEMAGNDNDNTADFTRIHDAFLLGE